MKNIIILFSILISYSSFGQEELTVVQAIEKALANNYQIKLVNANSEIASLQNNWGSAGLIPTFSINVTNAASLTDNTNNPASFFPGQVFSDNLKGSLDMNWTIFNGFGIRINKARLEQLEVQTKGNAMVVIETTIYDVIIAYYSAVVQERKLGIVKDLLIYSKNKLSYFELKNDLGTSSSFDLLQFKNQVLSDSSNIVLQELALKNAIRNLNLVMGASTELTYTLTDELNFEVPSATFTQMQDKMQANNLNLKNQFFNLELQELNTRAQKSAYYPVVSLNLGAAPSVGYFKLLGDQGFSSNTNSMNYYGNISARYTLFNGWNRKRNVEISKIQYQIADIQVEDLKLKLNHQLKNSFELYAAQFKIEQMSLQSVKNANLLWSQGKDRYDLGLINIFNLNDIKISYERSTIAYYDKIFDLLKTHYSLLRLTGQISQEYNVK